MQNGNCNIENRKTVEYLLLKENKISYRIHDTVFQILKHGIESDVGKSKVSDMVYAIKIILDDIERHVKMEGGK